MGKSFFKKEKLQQYRELESKIEKKFSVLIVDDEPDNVRTLGDLLNPFYHIFKAKDGVEALDFLKSRSDSDPIHMIISDQRMPRMSGVEFLKRSIALFPRAKRIILTGFTDIQVIIDSINFASIHKFILKPFEQEDLLLTIQRALETYDLETKNIQLFDELKELNQTLEQKVVQRTQELEHSHRELQEKNEELVEREKVYQADLGLAANVQASLFRGISPPSFIKADMRNIPYTQVTGDIYHSDKRKEDAFDIFLGDAIGHGVTAGFLTILAHQALAQVPDHWSLVGIMDHLNRLFLEKTPFGIFMTGAYVRITPDGLLRLATAGHPPILIISKDGNTTVLESVGPFLGMLSGFSTAETIHKLKKGDKIFIYTDGCYEFQRDGIVDSEMDLFQSWLLKNPFNSIYEILQYVDQQWQSPQHAIRFVDDATIIALEYVGIEDDN